MAYQTDPAGAPEPPAPASEPPAIPAAIPAASEDAIAFASARTRKELAFAELAEQKLALRRGELVRAADVAERWTSIIVTARGRLLGVPSKCKSRCQELTLRQVAVIDEEIRVALELLADDFESKDAPR